MSKKKNTLSDLEEFLKLQASTLVTPTTLTDKTKKESPPAIASAPAHELPATGIISEDEITEALLHLGQKNKTAFYNSIIKATKNLSNYSMDDALLINTALYLKGGVNWKDTVRDYWKGN